MKKIRITIIIVTILLIIDIGALGVTYYYRGVSNKNSESNEKIKEEINNNSESNKQAKEENDNKMHYYIYKINSVVTNVFNKKLSSNELIDEYECVACEIRKINDSEYLFAEYNNDDIKYLYVDYSLSPKKIVEVTPTITKKGTINDYDYIFDIFTTSTDSYNVTFDSVPKYNENEGYFIYSEELLKEGIIALSGENGGIFNINNNSVILSISDIVNSNKYMQEEMHGEDYFDDKFSKLYKFDKYYIAEFDIRGYFYFRTVFTIENDIPNIITTSYFESCVDSYSINFLDGKKNNICGNSYDWEHETSSPNYYIVNDKIYFIEDDKLYVYNDNSKEIYEISDLYKPIQFDDVFLLYIDNNMKYKVYSLKDDGINNAIDTNVQFNEKNSLISYFINNDNSVSLYIYDSDVKNNSDWKKIATNLINKNNKVIKNDGMPIFSCKNDKCTFDDLYGGYLYKRDYYKEEYTKKAFLSYKEFFGG